MIRIIFPSSGLTPDIIIKDTALETVSTGEMTETGPTNDGRFWYEYDYTGTPWAEYQISVDAGIAVIDPELRYVNFWAEEENTPETIATAVRTELTLELSRIDVAISSVSGGGGGEWTGGVGFYMSGGGGVDTKEIEKKFTEIMTEIKKDPVKYTKALEDTKKAIVDTVNKMPTPLVNVTAPEVKIEVPPEFLQEIRTIVQNFNEWATGKVKATEDAYTVILKRFRENIATDIQNAVRNDQSSFDSVIESAILRATSEFTSALSNITLIEES